MTSTPQLPLRQVVTSTFEDLALVLPDAEPAPQVILAPLVHVVRVGFHGPRNGFVELRAANGVAVAAARNMLVEHDPTPELCRDALAEVANVICGNLVPLLRHADDIYRLDPPQSVFPASEPAAQARADLVVDGGRVQVRLVLDDEADRSAA